MRIEFGDGTDRDTVETVWRDIRHYVVGLTVDMGRNGSFDWGAAALWAIQSRGDELVLVFERLDDSPDGDLSPTGEKVTIGAYEDFTITIF